MKKTSTPDRSPSRAAALARQLHVIGEMAAAASGISDLDELAKVAVDRVRDLLQMDSVTLRWWDPTSERLISLARNARIPVPAPPLTSGRGASGVAFKTARPCVVQDYAAWENAEPSRLGWGLRSVVSVPLLSEGRPVGALGAANFSLRRFTKQEVELLQLLAAQLGPALRRAALLKEAEAQRRRMEGLHKVMLAAAGILDPRTLSDLVAGMAADLLSADVARVTALDEPTGTLRVIGASDPGWADGTHFEAGGAGGALGLTFTLKEPVVVGDYRRWPLRLDQAVERGCRSIMAVPLLVRDHAIGAMSVISLSRRQFTRDQVQFLSLLGAQVAPVIEAARSHAQIGADRRRLETILANAPLALFTLGSEGRCTFAEGRALSVLGVAPDRLVGKLLSEVLPEGDRVEAGVRQVLKGQEFRCALSSRSREVDLELDLGPLLGEGGQVAGVIGVAVDVSERRRAREAQEASEAQSRFMAAMSHELRTPLNSILGFAQLLAMPEFANQATRQRYVRNILTSGHHLLNLINDVLDVSRVRAGRVELDMAAIPLRPCLVEAAEQIRPLAAAAGLSLEVTCDPEIVVRADRRRLLQVLLNLASNAVKFTPEGHVHLKGEADKGWGRITVTDTGIGIAAEDQTRIFEEFVQIEAGPTRLRQGAGLGLPLTKSLVEAMGGSVKVASEAGKGSAFTVVLRSARRTKVAAGRLRAGATSA